MVCEEIKVDVRAKSPWEESEAWLRALGAEDRRRVAGGEATASEINAVNYAWPDPADCLTLEPYRDVTCLDLEMD